MAAQASNNNNNTNSNSKRSKKSLKRSLQDADIPDMMEAPPAKFLKVVYNKPILKVKKLSENAKLPVKGSEYAAGYDLHAANDMIVAANGKALVMTDIAIAVPHGCYGRIAPRSGLAWKHHIDIGAGVIDSDFRGNVGVVMFNHNNKDFNVTKHMRIAQLILEKYESSAMLTECEDLDDTVRGVGGFGSTGTTATLDKIDNNSNKDGNNNNNNNNENSNDNSNSNDSNDNNDDSSNKVNVKNSEENKDSNKMNVDKDIGVKTNDNEQKDAESVEAK